jgi:hypothetical protein
MSEEKKEPWLNYLALTTVIFAVCATLSTFKGGGYSTKSVISQAQASDQWAFFQAKNIRENMYRIQKENLELQAKITGAQNPDSYNKYEEAIKSADEKIGKYVKEKGEIQIEAKKLESKRDDAQKHGQPFGIAVIFFQVSILLSSIAALFKQKSIWYLALPIGCVGLFYFIDGFFLFY